MPLTELMNYFNDQLQTQGRAKALPKTGFYKADNSYWARFGSLILGSQFHVIQAINNEDVIGYEAELTVRASTGNLLNIDSIFNSLDNIDQIVHLDRLVRTLHSLNYLQQFDGQEHLLSLQVQPRHIISVTEDHGKTFEAILSDCGLKPERVLLHTRLLDNASLPHFNKALGSYSQRGYNIGVSLTQARELTLLASLDVRPDVIFIHYPVLVLARKQDAASIEKSYLTPVELYQAKRILVAPDASLGNQFNTEFDGILIAQAEPGFANDSFQHVNAF